MLNSTSCQLGTNLARALHGSGDDLTPVAGSLLQALCAASNPVVPAGATYETLPALLEQAAQGHHTEDGGHKSYCASAHDTLMDQYSEDVALLVSQHIQYARAVVYPQIEQMLQTLQLAQDSSRSAQAEDFFDVQLYELDEFFTSSEVVAAEVRPLGDISHGARPMGTSTEVLQDLQVLDYIAEQEEACTLAWLNQLGEERIKAAVLAADGPGAQEGLSDQLVHAGVNFLFYRALTRKQDLNYGYSLTQLSLSASYARDHYAAELRRLLNVYDDAVRAGQVIMAHSQVDFSYLVPRRFTLTLYGAVVQQALEAGNSLEQIFGYVARHGRTDLTLAMLKEHGVQYSQHWNQLRGLYLTHLHNYRDRVVKETLRMSLPQIVQYGGGEDHAAFLSQNPGFGEKTAELIDEWLRYTNVNDTELQDLCVQAVAAVAHRHSSAYTLISQMLRLQRDHNVDASHAATFAALRYVTDFLLAQVNTTRSALG